MKKTLSYTVMILCISSFVSAGVFTMTVNSGANVSHVAGGLLYKKFKRA